MGLFQAGLPLIHLYFFLHFLKEIENGGWNNKKIPSTFENLLHFLLQILPNNSFTFWEILWKRLDEGKLNFKLDPTKFARLSLQIETIWLIWSINESAMTSLYCHVPPNNSKIMLQSSPRLYCICLINGWSKTSIPDWDT